MKTWQLFEKILDSTLESRGYVIEAKNDYKFICLLSGRKHIPDKIIKDENNKIIILSKKWQEVSGTAEEKIIYEIFKLIDLKNQYPDLIKSLYILIGGGGWSPNLKNYYLSGGWNCYLTEEYRNIVKITTIDNILTLINKKSL